MTEANSTRLCPRCVSFGLRTLGLADRNIGINHHYPLR
jgi:hypothetical protein